MKNILITGGSGYVGTRLIFKFLISKEINYDCFKDLVKISKKNGVKKFIYASSCSVYGVSESVM